MRTDLPDRGEALEPVGAAAKGAKGVDGALGDIAGASHMNAGPRQADMLDERMGEVPASESKDGVRIHDEGNGQAILDFDGTRR